MEQLQASNMGLNQINLKDIMGEDVYRRFAVHYHFIAKGTGCERGYGKMLSCSVTQILEWLKRPGENNKEKMDTYAKNNPTDGLSIMWLAFKDMFVTCGSYMLTTITQIAESLDIGVFNALAGKSRPSDLYSAWKIYRGY